LVRNFFDPNPNGYYHAFASKEATSVPGPVLAIAIPGDYNRNGVVDGADYVVWRNERTAPSAHSPADGNFDGEVDDEDYAIWRLNYGTDVFAAAPISGRPSRNEVPEPPMLLFTISTLAVATHQRSVKR
jgi:hypothetical protein